MTAARDALRAWILHRRPDLAPAALQDDTPLLQSRLLTSLDLMELIVFLERLRARPVNVEELRAGAFRDVSTLCRNFLEDVP
jgi:hypothetical protein